MRLKVWYPGPRDENLLRRLREMVSSIADVESGEPPECDVLIEGRPTTHQLARIRHGGSVVVPFAGVPPATIESLRARPDLTLHNLHHNGPETAETTLALLFATAKRLHVADRELRKGDWSPRYLPDDTLKLEGKHALVLGMGAIGSRVAAVCVASGMMVKGIRRRIDAPETQDLRVGCCSIPVPVYPLADLKALLPETHVLILAIPLTEDTKGLIGRDELAALAKPSMLINAARSLIVAERDLYEALRDGVLHAAGLDVWYRYPKTPEGIVPQYFHMPEEARHTHPSEFPFHELDNVLMSPHRGGSSREAEDARIEHLAAAIQELVRTGAMPNRIDLDAGY